MAYNQSSTGYYGLDVPISKLKTVFQNNLFSGYDYVAYGQAYNLNNDNVPYVYDESDDKYVEVLFDDKQDAISFFYQSGESTPIDGEYFETNVEILFALKLSEVKDGVTRRDIEEISLDIYNLISRNSVFVVTGRVIGMEAFSSFDTSKISTKDMIPSMLLKYNTIVKFKMQ